VRIAGAGILLTNLITSSNLTHFTSVPIKLTQHSSVMKGVTKAFAPSVT
jgi:hypothetical protein